MSDGDSCEKCGKPATIHLTEIHDGQKVEKHLCEECAASDGLTVKHDMPLSKFLEDFVLATHTGGKGAAELQCDVCGMTFAEFRKKSLLGCSHDYDAFEAALLPLLEHAQEGATHHVGKVPHRAGDDPKRHVAVLRLRAELNAAIEDEDYERAAALRDQIKELDKSGSM